VHLRFHLLPETLHMTVLLLDRYLQTACKEVSKKELQLVGVSCMFAASKYEEMYAPEIQDFVYITDNAYTKRDILRTEIKVLSALCFDIGRPHSIHFLRHCNLQIFGLLSMFWHIPPALSITEPRKTSSCFPL